MDPTSQMSSTMPSSSSSTILPDPDDGFVLSNVDDPNHPTNFTKPNSIDKVKKGKGNNTEEQQYILGTLIVRVVAARNLQLPQQSGGGVGVGGVNVGGILFSASSSLTGGVGGSGTSTNPYASVKFGNSTQRSSEVFDTTDPIWPRQETMFMDVSLPLSQLTHPEPDESAGTTAAAAAAAAAAVSTSNDTNTTMSSDSTDHFHSVDDPYAGYHRPNTILTVAIFHTPEIGRRIQNKFGGGGGIMLTGDSDDLFLGVASVDLTPLFTGKIHTFDKWLKLHGASPNVQSLVRIVCEYEPSDVPPKPGDICKFTRYCHPKDLYPLEPGRSYKVEQVLRNGEIVLLSYQSQEGWILSFQVHKNMLICEERHVSVLDTAQVELQTISERLAYSPLVATVTETAERVVDDGLVGVAEEMLQGGFSLVNRWFQGGLDTVIGDLQDVTNMDGRYNPETPNPLELSSPMASAASLPVVTEENEEEDIGAYLVEEEDDDDDEALPYMPPCPITGFPMIEPVVAADGHTYEKTAIARWLKTSDKSPMTGAILVHKELVPNYGLMSSVQEAVDREKRAAMAAAKPLKTDKSESPAIIPANAAVTSDQNEEKVVVATLITPPEEASNAPSTDIIVADPEVATDTDLPLTSDT